jgi:hypothetical protein
MVKVARRKSPETKSLGRVYKMYMEMNTSSQAEQQMNTTLSNHPGFQPQPMGTKKLRLVHPSKSSLTFGDFVAGVYHTWGKRRAKGIIDLAIKVHVIEFRGTERFVVS